MKSHLLHMIALVAMTLLLVACGGGDDADSSKGGSTDSGSSSAASDVDVPEGDADALWKAFMDEIGKATETLKTVTDADSAKAAVPTMKAHSKKTSAIMKEWEKLTESDRVATKQKFYQETLKADSPMNAIKMEVSRLSTQPQVMMIIASHMKFGNLE